jgi:7-cyano-7-deazaguanine synthase in queuosine biosynthesis
MGIHAGDFSIYPDCRQEFRDIDLKHSKQVTGVQKKYILYSLFHGHKFDILKMVKNVVNN